MLSLVSLINKLLKIFKFKMTKQEKNKYFQMVENCFLTFLSTFNDKEIQLGLDELKRRYKELEQIKFQEKYVFIKAQK